MTDQASASVRKSLQEQLQQMPPADWVRQMIDHHRRTGAYRAQDLRRLLGDPKRGVETGPQTSLASHFAQR